MSHLLVFDLDGTLIDSRRDLADSTNDVLESYGANPLPTERIISMVGEGARVLVARALEAAGLEAPVPEALDRFRIAYDRRLVLHTRPYDGIPELLDQLAGRALLAVLTNKPEAPTLRLLEAFSLRPRFRWVIGGDSTFPRKPEPAGLDHLITRAGVSRAGVLLVGDSMIDVHTARRAGVRLCAALYGFGRARGDLVLDPADLRAGNPWELATVLEAWLASAGA